MTYKEIKLNKMKYDEIKGNKNKTYKKMQGNQIK